MSLNYEYFYKEVKELYPLYKEAQLAIATAEELQEERKYLLSEVNELRAVLHHIMAAFDSFEGEPGSDKWQKEILKAKEEHLPRAIFDAYTVCIDALKKEIKDTMEKYDVTDYITVFPKYGNEIKPYIVEQDIILAEARTVRTNDAILKYKDALIKTKTYKKVIDGQIESIEKYIKEKNVSEEERRRSDNKTNRNNILQDWIIGITATLLGGFLGWGIPKVLEDKKDVEKNNPKQEVSKPKSNTVK